MNNTIKNNPSLLAALRQLRPNRRLTVTEARTVVERQAACFLRLVGGPTPVSLDALDQLPRLRLEPDEDMPVSGSSHWNGSDWIISVNAAEPARRQRYTAFHELHHVIEHPYRRFARDGQAEVLADQFSACVLMPRRAVTRAWCNGNQSIARLADRFEVSEEAIRIRLIKLGLLDGTRHDCRRRSGQPTVTTGGIR